MSITSRTPSTVVAKKFISELYSQRIIDTVHNSLVAWDAVTSEWRNDLVLGNILYITKSNTVTATEVVVGTKASALNPLNTNAVTLTIDQWFEAPVDFDDMTLRQTHVDIEAVAVKEGAYAIDKKMDTSICNLFSSLGGYSTAALGSDGQQLSDDLLIAMQETLNEADVPMDRADRSLIVDPSGLADMLKIDKLVAADYVNRGNIENGIIGNSVYGCVVRVTNNLSPATTGAYGVMIHRRAIASAAQIDKAWTWHYLDLHQTRYQAEALWGVIEVQDAFGVPFYTRKS